ncbi:hypothetical protein LSG40_22975 [Pseudomonas aeruginosa]|uniref:hypothetical protein n=1 Tax=Pseudomonas aeruginosa TaxID=287 RepID=UPI001F2E112E|nr:hypothetical protein [Pseudomonas aeruginosa]MCZ9674061.1 hypothetical protein [Pseudomonas aeruginosa]MCZ9764314.1 hypothetical protein [Pseudomonas aeruginosa]MDP5933515.1 hypothetical protein [Pseudomonas aeruginosa]UGW92848.1 hypothetical protein LSG40_22975 [Pseudomonas aeruginosa]WGJ72674.1 hypothetical protein OK431_23675 [Pseudomonas aeruginosa]
MSQKTEQDSRPIAEAVDLPEISVEHSTEFLTGSAPCAGVSRPLPAAWLGQRGIYRSRFEAVCNGEQLVDPLTLGELIQHAWRYLYLTRRAGLGLKPARQPLTSTTKTPEATDAAVDQMIAEEDADIRQDLTQQAEAERPELWAVHAQGPDELYAAFSRADAEKHAAELNCLPVPVYVSAVVIPSPWPPAEHWQYLAEQERDHKNEIAVRLRQFERICEGLPQDAIDGGWTVQGIRAHSKQLEEQLKVTQAEVEALRAENSKLSEALDRWPLIRDRLNLRLDYALAKISKLESRWPGKEVPQAWLDVQAERRRQVEVEGWTPEHDDAHSHGQMAQAAGCYALHAGGIDTDWPGGIRNGSALFWPWDKDWWKPTTTRRDLVKACALGLAEIERLDRAAASQGGPSDA